MKIIKLKNSVLIIIVFFIFTNKNSCQIIMKGSLDCATFNNNQPSRDLSPNLWIFFTDRISDFRINFSSSYVEDRKYSDIFYKTSPDIPFGHGYTSGKTFIILSNGTRIQTQGIIKRKDSSFKIYTVRHTIDTESPILQITEFPIERIEFEIYYFKKDGKKKILLEKTVEIGNFKPESPIIDMDNLKTYIKKTYNIISKVRKSDAPLSELLDDRLCDFEFEDQTWSKTVEVEFVADPKTGPEKFYITADISVDVPFFRLRLNRRSDFNERSLKLISENNDTLQIPYLVFEEMYGFMNGYYSFEDKNLIKIFELLDIKSIEFTRYNGTGYNDIARKTQSLLTKKGKSELEKLKMFFSCVLMKISELEKKAQQNSKK